MNRGVLVVAIVLSTDALVSGTSSRLVTSWRNPKDRTEVRADFEDLLAAQLASIGLEAVPGNAILPRPKATQLDLNYLKEQIRANQIEAVVVSRLIKVEDTVTYIPGAPYFVPFPYYNTFYGYYGTIYPVAYSPSYLQKEKNVRIETNLYVTSEPDEQLVWTGITDTFNPSYARKAIKALIKLVVTKMQGRSNTRPRYGYWR